MESPSQVRRDVPAGYTNPPFPSLFWPPQESTVILYELDEMWKFTLYWTLILYGLFHLGAVGVAVLMQVGKRRSHWKYLWLVPLVYALIAGAEALIAGSVAGLMLVSSSLRPSQHLLTSGTDFSSYSSNNNSTSSSNPDRIYLPHQSKSLSGIAARSFALGIALAIGVIGTLAILLGTSSPLWRLPFFLASLSTFHFLEFWTTAAYNTRAAEVSSFLLTSNWPGYAIAHTFATLECLATHLLWPGARWIPRFPFSSSSSSLSGPFDNPGLVLTLLGFGLVVLGQTVRSVAMVQAGPSFNHHVQSRRGEGHVLVTSGVYSVLRHPSYFGFFWWALGTQMVMGNVVSFVGYAVVLWRFFSRRIRHEEAFLVGFFGREYEEYRKRVGTKIPFVN
ncbi:Protein-S-isoprenylcysteine O-methyltransferase [Madurella mycetomatis]|uniref:Protein-S-isoprenylcysteine O-methyltransferase n=1 Tax=Madurella mycetomatis TaxID=100816 RepID=A0A175VXB0_9PEZI|nr:Protein-S-isoprenylcysteine O-methyltransferase [Madurella mycetomatis]